MRRGRLVLWSCRWWRGINLEASNVKKRLEKTLSQRAVRSEHRGHEEFGGAGKAGPHRQEWFRYAVMSLLGGGLAGYN
jgi:hypothetical protein